MSSLVFIADDSIQSTTTTTISGTSTYTPVYAYKTSPSSLSSFSYLYLNNLNAEDYDVVEAHVMQWQEQKDGHI
jgi:hypothetical protein